MIGGSLVEIERPKVGKKGGADRAMGEQASKRGERGRSKGDRETRSKVSITSKIMCVFYHFISIMT